MKEKNIKEYPDISILQIVETWKTTFVLTIEYKSKVKFFFTFPGLLARTRVMSCQTVYANFVHQTTIKVDIIDAVLLEIKFVFLVGLVKPPTASRVNCFSLYCSL